MERRTETSKFKRQYFHDKDLHPHIKEEHVFLTITSIKTQSVTQEFCNQPSHASIMARMIRQGQIRRIREYAVAEPFLNSNNTKYCKMRWLPLKDG